MSLRCEHFRSLDNVIDEADRYRPGARTRRGEEPIVDRPHLVQERLTQRVCRPIALLLVFSRKGRNILQALDNLHLLFRLLRHAHFPRLRYRFFSHSFASRAVTTRTKSPRRVTTTKSRRPALVAPITARLSSPATLYAGAPRRRGSSKASSTSSGLRPCSSTCALSCSSHSNTA